MCKSRRPCRTAWRCASNSRVRDRRGTSPCSERRESGPVRGFPARSFGGEHSQSLPLAVGAVLRRADEHFHEVVVQRVEKLALKTPFELRVIEIARVQVEIVSVHRNALVFELNDDLDALALGAGGEIQQWVLIQAQLREDAFGAR